MNSYTKLKETESLVFLIYFFLFTTFFSSCSSVKNKAWKGDAVIDKKYVALADQVDSFLSESNFQGAVLIGKGKKIVFAKGYGSCDKKTKKSDSITIQTTFEAGSITKQMTAAAIMQLVEQKKLSVDDKLSKYFPEYVHGDEITIKMLLNMRSGLTDYLNSGDEFFPVNIYRHIEKNQVACKPVDENIVLTYFYDAPLLTSPDSTYFYCNTNYYLLAKIIEQLSGVSYQQYIQENIFNRCGMEKSNLEYQKTDARGYDYKNRYYSIPSALSFGCGDLNSNVVDLFKWNTMFANGKVVSKKSLKKMIDTESYGFGIYRKDSTIFHSGTTNVFNSYNLYDFDEKLSIIVLTNCPIGEENATLVAGKIKKIIEKKETL